MDKKILRTDLDLISKIHELQQDKGDSISKDDIPGLVTSHPKEYVFCPANEHFKYAINSGTLEMLFSAVTKHRDDLGDLLNRVQQVTEEALKPETRPRLVAERLNETKHIRGGKGFTL